MMRLSKSIVWIAGMCLASSLSAQVTVHVASNVIVPQGVPESRVTMTRENTAIKEVLREIGRQAGVNIAYAGAVTSSSARVSLDVKDAPVFQALQQALQGTGLRFRVAGDGQILVEPSSGTQKATNGVVVGKVVHARTKQPIAGAQIVVDHNTQGVATGDDGSFRISLEPGEHTLQVRALGMVRQAKKVVVQDGGTVTVEILLEPNASVLDEVIVTGTVVATERKEIPTPITVITAAELEQRGITKIEQLFRGEIPGVFALEMGTSVYRQDALGGMVSTQVYTRGSRSLGGEGGTTPLKTYVDGVELLDPSYLGTIDPKSIERIEIVTGPQAAAIYGSGGQAGVMQIFTKKGAGQSTPDITATIKYGILQNNLSDGLTPAHNHALSVTGGSGPDFSYSAGLTYNYTGQWQPYTYNRMIGASIGAQHTRGPVTASGSLSTTTGSNGTVQGSARDRMLDLSGEWKNRLYYQLTSGQVSSSSSQMASFNLDYTPASWSQHRLTVGRSQNHFNMNPFAPFFRFPNDSMYYVRSATGQRTTMTYNSTLTGHVWHHLSTVLTFGANHSAGQMINVSGSKARKTASSYASSSANTAIDDRNWGGFGSVRFGLFERLYLTLNLRGEYNPNNGESRRISWTPSNGLAYTMELGEMTVKLLGSYGRATRAPSAEMRLGMISYYTYLEPAEFQSRLPNPDLTPEYSRGPQGGIELYYGNMVSITVNHYQQKITDMIQQLPVDSVERFDLNCGCSRYIDQYQNINTASVRQRGWEGTGSVRFGFLTLKGAYTFADTKVLSFGRNQGYYDTPYIGLPSHNGNVTVNFAHGGTSLSLVNNFVGQQLSIIGQSPLNMLLGLTSYWRLPMYSPRQINMYSERIAVRGYMKSDLAFSQRISPWASFTVNVVNLGNSFGQEQVSNAFYHPTLGRTTTLGVSMRFPRTR